MITFDQAITIIAKAAGPLGTETIGLERAAGRILAAPVIAAIDSPRSDVSAMDGYAVRSADLGPVPVALKIIGESFPGTGWKGMLNPGECARIFTGAPVPDGADRVVIQEQVRRDGAMAMIDETPSAAMWIRPKGKDFRIGDELLSPGRLLDAAALVAVAGADRREVEVYGRPRLALLATGDELVEPGAARGSPLAIPDSVSIALSTAAGQWGARIVAHERLRDDPEVLQAAARRATDLADVVVVTGGASVGEHDFAKSMFEPLGLDLFFAKVAIRPGKPAWFGQARDRLVLGLPGNPTSALVTARILLAPLLAAMQGRPVDDLLRWEPARLASPLLPCDNRETFHRARLNAGEASILEFQESHAQKTLAQAQILVRQAANSPGIAAGTSLRILRL